MISDEIRKEFAQGILINDVISYIDTHKLEYEEWQKKRKQRLEKNFRKEKLERKKAREEADYEVC